MNWAPKDWRFLSEQARVNPPSPKTIELVRAVVAARAAAP